MVLVIGGGFTGMSTAACLRRMGMDVTLVEKHPHLGGRARSWHSKGFTFDMGPSWYLMPEVFENFFIKLGKKREDYYSLKKLSPSYRVFFQGEDPVDIGPELERTLEVFEGFEKGGGTKLTAYLADASYKYKLAMERFLYKDYRSFFQFLDPLTAIHGLKLGVFGNLHRHVKKYFSDFRAQRVLEYAMVFLGTSPHKAPALYSIMSHVDLVQGVFFPHGGMGAMVNAMKKLIEDMGVRIETATEVQKIIVEGGRALALQTEQGDIPGDYIVGTGDYHHLEHDLLEEPYRNFKEKFWNKALLSPSMFILYLGLGKKIPQLAHHNLFFSSEWDRHFEQIFNVPAWPDNPSYYVSSVSCDDASMSPPGKENIFVLVPIAPGLEADKEYLQYYAEKTIGHLEALTGQSIRNAIEVQRIYSVENFRDDYHALKGTALGLSHTLGQTAVFRPPMRNKKLDNVFYAGQYTHPGVGVPMCFIAAEVVSGIVTESATRR